MSAAGTTLRNAREAAGISQAELARRAGTTQAHVSRTERGLISPTVRTLDAMLRVVDAELTLTASQPIGWCDDDQVREFRALSMEDRLIQGFRFMEFGSKLFGQAKR